MLHSQDRVSPLPNTDCESNERERERRGNASQCEQEAHEARKRDRRKKKLIHGIADPLTKLSLTITAGGIQHRSVRESSGSGGRREEGPGENVSRVARGSACEAT